MDGSLFLLVIMLSGVTALGVSSVRKVVMPSLLAFFIRLIVTLVDFFSGIMIAYILAYGHNPIPGADTEPLWGWRTTLWYGSMLLSGMVIGLILLTVIWKGPKNDSEQ